MGFGITDYKLKITINLYCSIYDVRKPVWLVYSSEATGDINAYRSIYQGVQALAV